MNSNIFICIIYWSFLKVSNVSKRLNGKIHNFDGYDLTITSFAN